MKAVPPILVIVYLRDFLIKVPEKSKISEKILRPPENQFHDQVTSLK